MQLDGLGAGGVFGEEEGVAVFPGGAGGGFDAHVGGDSAQHDGGDAATAELEVEVGAVESTPLVFEDDQVAGLGEAIGKFAEFFGEAAGRDGHGLIDGLARSVFEVGGKADVDEDDGRASLTEAGGEFGGGFQDISGGVWREGAGEDAFLQVDENEGGGGGVEGVHVRVILGNIARVQEK